MCQHDMNVKAIKTHKITTDDKDILEILDKYLPRHSGEELKTTTPESEKEEDSGRASLARMTNGVIRENSVVVVTSKIIAICEGRVAEDTEENRDRLVEEEAEYYLPRHSNKYDFCISIKHNTFTATAGIDRSNGNGKLVLWPKDPQESVNKIREYLCKRFGLKNIGVITTDSKTSPLRWGVTGVALSHSGFKALKDYINTPDVFGRKLQFEKLNIADSLASAAVAVMGEGSEQTPLAIIEDLPFVEFQDRNPTQEELDNLRIELEDDVFAPLLTSVDWKRGRGH